MRIAVARESAPGEARVAMVPELVVKLAAAGYEVAVQSGAGAGALFTDAAYRRLVRRSASNPSPARTSCSACSRSIRAGRRSSGATTISFFPIPSGRRSRAPADHRLTTFGMEYVPRISRAQSMDALSSQSLVAGYRGAIVAAGRLRQFFPLSMTAAGTVRPAQVVVLGAGVAGLQAIATCRRLGAVVKGYDVRVCSGRGDPLDGRPGHRAGAADPGRGRRLRPRDDRGARATAAELLAPYVAAADALITTAAVPGRQAPVLVTTEMVAPMAAGSVVVDLAAESGGNVEGVVAGAVVSVRRACSCGAVPTCPARCPARPAGSTPRTCST